VKPPGGFALSRWVRDFGEDKPCLRQESGRVVLAVVALVGGKVRDAEIRAQVDDLLARRHQDLCKIGGCSMRQRQKHKVQIAGGEGFALESVKASP
jgi:hypothetical protein